MWDNFLAWRHSTVYCTIPLGYTSLSFLNKNVNVNDWIHHGKIYRNNFLKINPMANNWISWIINSLLLFPYFLSPSLSLYSPYIRQWWYGMACREKYGEKNEDEIS